MKVIPSPSTGNAASSWVLAARRPLLGGPEIRGMAGSARRLPALRVPALLGPALLVPALRVAALLVPVLVGSALVGSGPAAAGDQPAAPPQHLPIGARWCPAGGPPSPSAPGHAASCVGLEVPRTWHQYTLGLQRRPPLPPGRGMWFAYRPAQVAHFWMHLTPQPLDMVFVRHHHVMAIEAAAAPCMRLPCPSYGPDEPVDGVLELAAGEASRLGLTVGSPLRVELLRSFGPTAPAPD